jgi:hypothetical protein
MPIGGCVLTKRIPSDQELTVQIRHHVAINHPLLGDRRLPLIRVSWAAIAWPGSHRPRRTRTLPGLGRTPPDPPRTARHSENPNQTETEVGAHYYASTHPSIPAYYKTQPRTRPRRREEEDDDQGLARPPKRRRGKEEASRRGRTTSAPRQCITPRPTRR